jgi:hypothetical protein
MAASWPESERPAAVLQVEVDAGTGIVTSAKIGAVKPDLLENASQLVDAAVFGDERGGCLRRSGIYGILKLILYWHTKSLL